MSARHATLLSICFLLIFSCLLTGCSETPDGREIVTSLLDVSAHPPVGEYYLYPAPSEGDSAHALTEEMQAVLFGNGTLPPVLDDADQIVCFLSPTHPYQIILLHAKSYDATDELAQLCVQRKDAICQYWQDREEMLPYLQGATVTVCRDWVMLAITEDPEATVRRFRRLL